VNAPRLYTVVFQAVAITASQDLFMIAPADDKPVELLAVHFGQHTDFGDAQDENLRWSVIRGLATVGSVGTSPTPQPVKGTNTAAGFTARCNDTTKAVVGAGTTEILHADDFNIRSGLYHRWDIPGSEPDCTQGKTRIVVRLEAAPVDSITGDGTLLLGEFG